MTNLACPLCLPQIIPFVRFALHAPLNEGINKDNGFNKFFGFTTIMS